ncbi:MAG TPA: DUF433 domain-containing protein [Gemmataceae bacterium]|nr:DUF433 domain-containing protein [Gemmataceae bacterium]
MQLEDYFEFEKFTTPFGPVERIRIKGHRIAIENVIDYFNQGMQPREICEKLPTLTLEEVYATVTYYLHNKEKVDAYNEEGEKIADAWYQEYLKYGPYFLRDRASEYVVGPEVPPDHD